jgi:hypothetical protein
MLMLDNRIGMDENGTQTWTLYEGSDPMRARRHYRYPFTKRSRLQRYLASKANRINPDRTAQNTIQ